VPVQLDETNSGRTSPCLSGPLSPGEPTVMTVNEVVESTMNRVAGLSLAQSGERRNCTRIEACEFELLLQRAMEILKARAESAGLPRA
jgi:hypothetical protein